MRRCGSAAAALGLLALAGCIAGPAPRDHFYRLEVPAPEAGAPTLPGVIEVERLTGDDVVRKPRILRSVPGSTEVTPYTYHLWVASPTLLLQRGLADYLSAARLADTVALPEAGNAEEWTVTGHLRRFDHVTGESVRVELELRLRRRRAPLATVQKVYRAEQPVGGGVDAATRAFGAAVGSIFERFTADARAAAP